MTFVATQWISVGATLSASLSSFDNNQELTQYSWIFSVAACTATVAAYTAYKFQGSKIGSTYRDQELVSFNYRMVPRNWKSNTIELLYLVFSGLLLLVNNYFLITAIKTMIVDFKDLDHAPHNLQSLALGEILLVAFKTFFIDFIFNVTNAYYETSEQIKNDITGSKKFSLVSRLCSPLTKQYFYKASIFWIKSIGVISHVVTDYFGLFLSLYAPISPHAFAYLYRNERVLFCFLMGVLGIISIPLLMISGIQTLYFEAKESESNLGLIKNEKIVPPYYPECLPVNSNRNFLHKVLLWKPTLKKKLRYTFFLQGPLHAVGDAIPVVLFMKDFFSQLQFHEGLATTAIVAMALFIFIGSSWGTYQSEVKTALHHYDDEFGYIVDNRLPAACA